jgi:hypothetical protein
MKETSEDLQKALDYRLSARRVVSLLTAHEVEAEDATNAIMGLHAMRQLTRVDMIPIRTCLHRQGPEQASRKKCVETITVRLRKCIYSSKC